MNKLSLLFILVLISSFYINGLAEEKTLSGVDTTLAILLPFSGKTNADLQMEAINNMEIPFEFFRGRGRPTIMVASLEELGDSEKSFPPPKRKSDAELAVEFIENGIVSKLTEAGYKVVERDYDILSRIYHEALGDKYLIYIGPDIPERDARNILLSMPTPSQIQPTQSTTSRTGTEQPQPQKQTTAPLAMPMDNPNTIRVFQEFFPYFSYENVDAIKHPFYKNKSLQEVHKIKSADYIFAFRVRQLGVREVDKDVPKEKGYPHYERYALAKIHLRIIDAKTGQILWAGTVKGEAKDKLPIAYRAIAQTGYYEFGTTSPVRYEYYIKTNTETSTEGTTTKPESSAKRSVLDALK